MSRAALRRIYRRIPKIECRGLCQEACGPIMLTEIERDRMEAAAGRKLGMIDLETITCPMLDDEGRCEVYAQRPLICRLWGVTEEMECPHGCEPERYLTPAEADELIDEINELSGVCSTLPGLILRGPDHGILR